MIHATNNDLVPVRAMTPEVRRRDERFLPSKTPTKEQVLREQNAHLAQTVGRLQQQADEFRKAIAERDRKIAKLTDNVGDYYRAILHYIQKLETSVSEETMIPSDSIVLRKSVREIIDEVLKDFPEVTYAELMSANRNRMVTAARFQAIWAVKQERPELSTVQLGRFFKRDHASIINALKKERDRRQP